MSMNNRFMQGIETTPAQAMLGLDTLSRQEGVEELQLEVEEDVWDMMTLTPRNVTLCTYLISISEYAS